MVSPLSIGLAVFGGGVSRAFRRVHPIYKTRPEITAKITGRLAESLQAVRVVKKRIARRNERRKSFLSASNGYSIMAWQPLR
jgi:ABC-type multidrug transport system fused ATPase/permease subunit